MSRQSLRSAKIGELASRANEGIERSHEDLDRTLTEVQEGSESLSTMDIGGHTTHGSHRNEEVSETLVGREKKKEREAGG